MLDSSYFASRLKGFESLGFLRVVSIEKIAVHPRKIHTYITYARRVYESARPEPSIEGHTRRRNA